MGEDRTVMDETMKAFELLEQADNLGSIMKFDLSAKTRREMALRYKEWEEVLTANKNALASSKVSEIMHSIFVILALSDKYSAVATNPPYMGSGNMNSSLASYVQLHYNEGKADLFAVFMLLSMNLLEKSGKMGMINMHSWMFISAFERLRISLLENYNLDSLLHLGPHTFDELSGEVVQNAAFVITNAQHGTSSIFYRLVEGKNCAAKQKLFLTAKESNGVYFRNVDQKDFENLPGCPIGYWISRRTLENFITLPPLSHFALGRVGLITGDSTRFIKNWQEVAFSKIGFNIRSNEESISSGKKWFPIHNGGSLRKWYGNLSSVVNWENDGDEMKNDNFIGKRCKSHNYNGDLAFRESFSWNTISSDKYTCRYAQPGFMFDTAGPLGK